MRSPITMMEQWMLALSVSTHTSYIITAPAGSYFPFLYHTGRTLVIYTHLGGSG